MLVAAKAPIVTERLQRAGQVIGKRHRTMFATLAAKQNLLRRLKAKIGSVKPAGLGDPGASTRKEEEQCVVAAALSCLPVGCFEKRIELPFPKVSRRFRNRTLVRNRQHALCDA